MKNSTAICALAFIMLCISAQAQAVSLIDLINKNNEKTATVTSPTPTVNIPNCQTVRGNVCAQCFRGYDLVNGGCVPTQPAVDPNSEEAQNVPEDFIPCNGQSNCGESQSFKSAAELNQFVNSQAKDQEAVPPPTVTPVQPVNPPPVAPIRQPTAVDQKSIQPTAFRQDAQIKPIAFRQDILPQPQAQSARLVVPQQKSSFQSQTIAQPQAQQTAVNPNLDFSGTNNQVEAVDEADLLKTDGSYIYTISGNQLSIIRSFPVNNAQVLSTINLGTFKPEAIFIEGDFLAVFGTDYSNYNFYYPGIPLNQYKYTTIRVYNVQNRANPFKIKEFKIEGSYFNGRKTQDGFIYVLSKQLVTKRINPSPWYDLNGQQIFIGWGSIFYYPIIYTKPAFVNIFAFNLRNPYSNQFKVVSLVSENAQQLYMSEKHIYITFPNKQFGQQYTKIHKVFVWRTIIVPFADGNILGSVDSQFWMDEFGPFLRVAAIVNNGAYNRVYCLNYHLNPYGLLNNIAPGERITAARYVGRRLYLVTFRQTDPFFVIGFNDHRFPVILGELKISGFSKYLHPYDEKTIIGLGRQATVNGRPLGLKLALFDVSNVWSPKEITSFELQETYASSEAETEHKAFLFSRERNLLVIPGKLNSAQAKFNGAFVFYIDRTQITLKSIVDHIKTPQDNFESRTVQRSLYIENFLYCKSKCLLSISSLFDYTRVRDIDIPCATIPQPSNPIIVAPPIFQPQPFPNIGFNPGFVINNQGIITFP